MNLKDIARLAGVSRSTVSRVINDDRRVSPEVRERVKGIIEAVGYHPNAAARALASRRSGVFGVVLPQPFGTIYNDPWFSRFIQGCLDGSREAGISMMLLMEPTNDQKAATQIIDRFVTSRHVDGLIISGSFLGDVLVPALAEQSFPYMMIGRDAGLERNFVDVNNRTASYEATRHLLSHGRTRPAMIAGPEIMIAAQDRRLGFLEAIVEAGFDPDGVPVRPVNYSQRDAFTAAFDLLSSDSAPDAIFAASDSMAIGALHAAQSLGVRVPEDLGVMGFDGVEPDRVTQMNLSTVRQPAHDLGCVAVSRLTELVHDNKRGPIQEWLDTEISLRHSCGCPSATGPPEATVSGKDRSLSEGASREATMPAL